MHRRPSKLLMVSAAAIAVATVVAGCEAKVYGTPPAASDAPQLTVVAPLGSMAPLPEAPPDEPAVAFTGLADREGQATTEASKAGADITVAILDRNTGQLVTNASGSTVAIASVVKLFIADDLLLQVAKGQTTLSPADRKTLDDMLRSSDDSAAEVFWNRSGGSAIINRVTARYGLGSTRPPGNGRWFNTISTVTDLVRYYDMLLAGTGGLPPEQASIILSNLAASTPMAIDGMMPAASTRSASASLRACTRNPLPSNRVGCVASVPTGCTSPPASSDPTAATSWRSAPCSPPATPRSRATPSPRP